MVLDSILYHLQYFEPNPYFEETKLIKSFAFHDEGTTEIAATPISWKEGMVTSFCHFITGISKLCIVFFFFI